MVKSETQDVLEDAGLFAAWLIFGVLVGWGVAYLAGHTWFTSPIYDFYGVVGAAIAALWVNFRRQKHLEHLEHIKTHLTKGKK